MQKHRNEIVTYQVYIENFKTSEQLLISNTHNI